MICENLRATPNVDPSHRRLPLVSPPRVCVYVCPWRHQYWLGRLDSTRLDSLYPGTWDKNIVYPLQYTTTFLGGRKAFRLFFFFKNRSTFFGGRGGGGKGGRRGGKRKLFFRCSFSAWELCHYRRGDFLCFPSSLPRSLNLPTGERTHTYIVHTTSGQGGFSPPPLELSLFGVHPPVRKAEKSCLDGRCLKTWKIDFLTQLPAPSLFPPPLSCQPRTHVCASTKHAQKPRTFLCFRQEGREEEGRRKSCFPTLVFPSLNFKNIL